MKRLSQKLAAWSAALRSPGVPKARASRVPSDERTEFGDVRESADTAARAPRGGGLAAKAGERPTQEAELDSSYWIG
jgi:hypothetical protein